MNRIFKKIIAAALAAITLTSTMVNASAYELENIHYATLTPQYYDNASTVPEIDASRIHLNNGFAVYYSQIEGKLSPGHRVLTIYDLPSTRSYTGSKFTSDLLEGLKLFDSDNKPLCHGKNPLLVYMRGYKDAYVMVGDPNIFRNFVTIEWAYSARLYDDPDHRVIDISYEFDDLCVLPNYIFKIGDQEVPYTTKFCDIGGNAMGRYDATKTACYARLLVPVSDIGKTLDFTINGIKIGSITVK